MMINHLTKELFKKLKKFEKKLKYFKEDKKCYQDFINITLVQRISESRICTKESRIEFKQ